MKRKKYFGRGFVLNEVSWMIFALTRQQDYIGSPGKKFDSGEIHTGFTLKINLLN